MVSNLLHIYLLFQNKALSAFLQSSPVFLELLVLKMLNNSDSSSAFSECLHALQRRWWMVPKFYTLNKSVGYFFVFLEFVIYLVGLETENGHILLIAGILENS